MAGTQHSFGKNEREKKKAKKRKEKDLKRQQRKEQNAQEGDKNEFVYVDKFGNLTDTPPDPEEKLEIEADDIILGIPKKEEGAEEASREKTGKVNFFDHSKGFGFIIDDTSNEKYFVHISGCIDEIEENDKVSYELQMGMKGMNAVKVKKI